MYNDFFPAYIYSETILFFEIIVHFSRLWFPFDVRAREEHSKMIVLKERFC